MVYSIKLDIRTNQMKKQPKLLSEGYLRPSTRLDYTNDNTNDNKQQFKVNIFTIPNLKFFDKKMNILEQTNHILIENSFACVEKALNKTNSKLTIC